MHLFNFSLGIYSRAELRLLDTTTYLFKSKPAAVWTRRKEGKAFRNPKG